MDSLFARMVTPVCEAGTGVSGDIAPEGAVCGAAGVNTALNWYVPEDTAISVYQPW